MVRIENDCCGCNLPCIGSSCPLKAVLHFYCDKCGCETDIYYYDDQELCIDCIEKRLEKVEE